MPPLCRQTSVSQTANVGTMGKNGLNPQTALRISRNSQKTPSQKYPLHLLTLLITQCIDLITCRLLKEYLDIYLRKYLGIFLRKYQGIFLRIYLGIFSRKYFQVQYTPATFHGHFICYTYQQPIGLKFCIYLSCRGLCVCVCIHSLIFSNCILCQCKTSLISIENLYLFGYEEVFRKNVLAEMELFQNKLLLLISFV